jgi:hypothetical protein
MAIVSPQLFLHLKGTTFYLVRNWRTINENITEQLMESILELQVHKLAENICINKQTGNNWNWGIEILRLWWEIQAVYKGLQYCWLK